MTTQKETKTTESTFGLGDDAGETMMQFFKVVALIILVMINLKAWGF